MYFHTQQLNFHLTWPQDLSQCGSWFTSPILNNPFGSYLRQYHNHTCPASTSVVQTENWNSPIPSHQVVHPNCSPTDTAPLFVDCMQIVKSNRVCDSHLRHVKLFSNRWFGISQHIQKKIRRGWILLDFPAEQLQGAALWLQLWTYVVDQEHLLQPLEPGFTSLTLEIEIQRKYCSFRLLSCQPPQGLGRPGWLQRKPLWIPVSVSSLL